MKLFGVLADIVSFSHTASLCFRPNEDRLIVCTEDFRLPVFATLSYSPYTVDNTHHLPTLPAGRPAANFQVHTLPRSCSQSVAQNPPY
jgi:hypothetical protein